MTITRSFGLATAFAGVAIPVARAAMLASSFGSASSAAVVSGSKAIVNPAAAAGAKSRSAASAAAVPDGGAASGEADTGRLDGGGDVGAGGEDWTGAGDAPHATVVTATSIPTATARVARNQPSSRRTTGNRSSSTAIVKPAATQNSGVAALVASGRTLRSG